jgi:hypothetical protein
MSVLWTPISTSPVPTDTELVCTRDATKNTKKFLILEQHSEPATANLPKFKDTGGAVTVTGATCQALGADYTTQAYKRQANDDGGVTTGASVVCCVQTHYDVGCNKSAARSPSSHFTSTTMPCAELATLVESMFM